MCPSGWQLSCASATNATSDYRPGWMFSSCGRQCSRSAQTWATSSHFHSITSRCGPMWPGQQHSGFGSQHGSRVCLDVGSARGCDALQRLDTFSSMWRVCVDSHCHSGPIARDVWQTPSSASARTARHLHTSLAGTLVRCILATLAPIDVEIIIR